MRYYYPELTNYQSEGHRRGWEGEGRGGQILVLPETPGLSILILNLPPYGPIPHAYGFLSLLLPCVHL